MASLLQLKWAINGNRNMVIKRASPFTQTILDKARQSAVTAVFQVAYRTLSASAAQDVELLMQGDTTVVSSATIDVIRALILWLRDRTADRKAALQKAVKEL